MSALLRSSRNLEGRVGNVVGSITRSSANESNTCMTQDGAVVKKSFEHSQAAVVWYRTVVSSLALIHQLSIAVHMPY